MRFTPRGTTLAPRPPHAQPLAAGASEKDIPVKFALTMLILVLLCAAAQAQYTLDAKGKWVKCGADDRACQIVPPSGTMPSQRVPLVIHPQPAPPPHERMK